MESKKPPLNEQKIKPGSYLKKGRLQDVIALITVLSIDNNDFKKEEDLKNQLRG